MGDPALATSIASAVGGLAAAIIAAAAARRFAGGLFSQTLLTGRVSRQDLRL